MTLNNVVTPSSKKKKEMNEENLINLYDSAKNFVIESLVILSKATSTPKEKIPFIIRRKRGYDKWIFRQETDFIQLVLNFKPQIVKLKSAEIFLCEALKMKSFYNHVKLHCLAFVMNLEHYKYRSIRKDFIDRVVLDLLMDYLNYVRTFKFNKRKFDLFYKEFVRTISNPVFNIIYVMPLFNFESENSEINLGKFKIKKITHKEKKKLYLLFDRDKDSRTVNEEIDNFLNVDFILEYVQSINKNEKLEIFNEYKEFKNALLKLRLYKKGTLLEGAIYRAAGSWISMSGEPSTEKAEQHNYNNFRLTKRERDDIEKYWTSFETPFSKNPSYLRVPLQRFEDSYTRKEDEDKIIDFFIALESIFLAENEKNELSYRLSLRISNFLHKDSKNKFKTFQFIREAYNIRSKIVHGSFVEFKPKKNTIFTNYSFERFVNEIEEITRKSIVKTIRKYPLTSVNIVEKLDELIAK